MLKFIKRKELDYNVYAPVDGMCIPLSEVHDKVFASKMLGDGVAFQIEDSVICAPCDGDIIMFAPTKHAFGLQADHGLEILIHVGLDTVNLQGEGFEILCPQGTHVHKGDPILKVDLAFMETKKIDLITPMIITDTHGMSLTYHHIGDKVTTGREAIISKN